MKSRRRLTVNLLCACMILAYIGFMIIRWKTIPDTIPIHFNAAGVADSYGSKAYLFLEPVIAVFLCAIISLSRLGTNTLKVTEKNRERVHECSATLLDATQLITTIMVLYAGIASVYGLSITVLYSMVGMLMLSIAIALMRMFQLK